MTPERLAQLRTFARYATYRVPLADVRYVDPNPPPPGLREANAGADILELCTAIEAPPTQWAAFVGTANGQSITLHPTRRAALEEVYTTLLGATEDPEHPYGEDAELEEAIEEHCLSGADDWYVQEVSLG